MRVSAEVERRAAHRLLKLVAATGGAIVVALAFYHAIVVERSVQTAVDAAFGGRIEVAALSLELAELTNLLTLVLQDVEYAEDNRFDPEVIQAAVALLERAAKVPTFTASPSFLLQLENIVDMLIVSAAGAGIDRLEELYRKQMVMSQGISVSLTDYYGRQLLSSPGAPNDWSDRIHVEHFGRYQRYSAVVRRGSDREVYVFYQLLIEHVRGGEDNRAVVSLMQEIGELGGTSERMFWEMTQRFAENKITAVSTAETTRLAVLMRGLLVKYASEEEHFSRILDGLTLRE